jgi:hypothetical protein
MSQTSNQEVAFLRFSLCEFRTVAGCPGNDYTGHKVVDIKYVREDENIYLLK